MLHHAGGEWGGGSLLQWIKKIKTMQHIPFSKALVKKTQLQQKSLIFYMY